MKPRWLLALVLPCCLASLAPAEEKGDQADLENGVWRLTGLNQDAKAAPPEVVKKADTQFIFKGGKLTIKTAGQSREGTFTVDAAKTPKAMTLVKDDKSKEDLAIYEINKDTLRVAVGKKERPRDFTPAADKLIYTYTREK